MACACDFSRIVVSLKARRLFGRLLGAVGKIDVPSRAAPPSTPVVQFGLPPSQQSMLRMVDKRWGDSAAAAYSVNPEDFCDMGVVGVVG